MQLAYLLLRSLHSILYILGDKLAMQQLIWSDIKGIMFQYFPPHDTNTTTKNDLRELDAKRNTS